MLVKGQAPQQATGPVAQAPADQALLDYPSLLISTSDETKCKLPSNKGIDLVH